MQFLAGLLKFVEQTRERKEIVAMRENLILQFLRLEMAEIHHSMVRISVRSRPALQVAFEYDKLSNLTAYAPVKSKLQHPPGI